MAHYEENIFALTLEALVEVDFLMLNFKHADRNSNQVAQSLRFANNAPPPPNALTLCLPKRTWRLSELAVMN
jgi:hypothetical protein